METANWRELYLGIRALLARMGYQAFEGPLLDYICGPDMELQSLKGPCCSEAREVDMKPSEESRKWLAVH